MEGAITNADAYQSLSTTDLSSQSTPLSAGGKATWLSSFLYKHMPHNRLKANEGDISDKYEFVELRRRRKKRGKSKATLPNKAKTAPKRRWIFDPNADVKYETYLPLKEMWTKYMEGLIDFSNLSDSGLSGAALKMMKADLHGCPLTVRRSRCPSYVGLCGIVVQETRNMFVLVTPQDQVRRVPKGNSVFNIVLHGHVFTIFGSQFKVKPGERASRKFKSKPSIDL